ncbi:Spa2 homology (SHD) of GIT [Penicillium malachiteum]|nr:Spa2 homology (SHD) of GIT [Penicillium malachiteum]
MNVNVHSGAMSPVSVDGSDWSGINQYQKSDPPFSPTFSTRGNLATPPTSGIPSAPLSPASTGLPLPGSLPGSGNPSPPSSVGGARSSVGTLGDDQRDGGRRRRQMEEILHQHYVTLKRFLSATYREDRINGRSAKARDKLLRLSPTQFHELSTDVYDELIRRQQASSAPGRPPRPDAPPFLPPRDDFHEKRNSARQKLASLQHQRFRDLATDVFCELERRFPQFTGRGRPPSEYAPRPFPPRQGSLGGPPPGMNGDGPLPRSFQSNTMVPNKSTMVEDSDDMGGDDDDDARSDAFALDAVLSRRGTTMTLSDGERKLLTDSQAQVSALQEKVEKLEEMIRSKDEELARSQDEGQSAVSQNERQEWDDLRQDLEIKVSQAEDLNSSLQLELDRVRTEQESVERELRAQIEEASQISGDADLAARFADLEVKHQSLQDELQQQQSVTAEVRREASEFLLEMKTLTAESHSNWEREERLSSDVQKLESEVDEWKNRYAKAKAQLRHLRTSSGGFSDIHPDASIIAKEHDLVQADGVVKDIHVTKFQMSIDELLRVARFGDAQDVSQHIKTVIFAVRCMVNDVDQAPPPVDGTATLRMKTKTRVSATANNMITAARNFANSSGLSPVSLLDAAASHLCTAVVELIRLVKIQASPADDLDDEVEMDMSQEKFPDYLSASASQRRYSNHSEYSELSPPDHDHPAMQNDYTGYGYGVPQEDHEVLDLKLYVEDQTDGMVQSIQALVASIRAEQELSSVETHVSAIGDVVSNVVSATEHLIHERSGDASLREQSEPVIHSLDECRGRLMNAVAEGHHAEGPEQLREVTNQLPPLAFEIARQTKELVQRLELLMQADDDDFR